MPYTLSMAAPMALFDAAFDARSTTPEMIFLTMLIIVASLAAIGVALKFIVRGIGVPCQFCNARLANWRNLSQADRQAILAYFREVEGREPNVSAVFTCRSCGSVFDDFSGEWLRRDFDHFGIRAYCKKCNAVMWNRKDIATWDGVSESPYMKCDACGTVHRWAMHGVSRFRFLAPPREVKTLHRCLDTGDA